MSGEPVRILLACGSLRAGSTNTALLATAHAIAARGIETTPYEGLKDRPHFSPTTTSRANRCRPPPTCAHTDVVEAACARIPIPRGKIGPDGLVADDAARERLGAVPEARSAHVEARRHSAP